MCGIWAALGSRTIANWTMAARALELVRHRGPDDHGIAAFLTPAGDVVLGNRRLAIQDTSARARQPMSSADGKLHLTFNGEIYNSDALFAELLGSQPVRRTNSDTEFLCEALRQLGLSILDSIKGFFAFVAYDGEQKQLLIARDRFGVKPLYYWQSQHGLAFASEIKQFTALTQSAGRLSAKALADYIGFGLFDHGPETFFQDIRQIGPGEAAIVDLTRPPSALAPFAWARPPRFDREMTTADRFERLHRRLSRSVSLAMTSTLPMGISLSGGLDSSTVAVLSSRQRNAERVQSLIGVFFDEPQIAEARYAADVAQAIGKPLLRETVDDDELIELFRDTIWHFDEPVARPSMLSQMKLYRAFRQHGLKVVLNGQGGDELFCGYPFMVSAWLIDALRAGDVRAILPVLAKGIGQQRPRQIRRGVLTELIPQSLGDRCLNAIAPNGGAVMRRIASLLDIERMRTRSSRASAHLPRLGWGGRLTAMRHALLRTAHLPMLLHYEDRASMASGVETRPVLLDHELVDAAFSLPASDILAGGILKGALRYAMRGHLPASVEKRNDKMGFATPEERWRKTRFGAWLRARALEGMEFAHRPLGELLPVAAMAERLRHGDDKSVPVWALASLGVWSQLYGIGS